MAKSITLTAATGEDLKLALEELLHAHAHIVTAIERQAGMSPGCLANALEGLYEALGEARSPCRFCRGDETAYACDCV